MPQKTKINIESLTKEYKKLQQQKYSKTGNVEARVLQNIAHAAGEIGAYVRGGVLRTDPRTDNLVNLNIGLIDNRKRKLQGRLSAVNMSFRAKPDRQKAEAFAQAEVVDQLILAQDQKADQPARIAEILEWQMVGGVAFEYCPYVPNLSIEPVPDRDEVTGEVLYIDQAMSLPGQEPSILPESLVQQAIEAGAPAERFELKTLLRPLGDFDSQIFGPLNVLVDHTVKDIQRLAPDQSIWVVQPRTVAWVREQVQAQGWQPDFNLDKLKGGQKDIRIVLTNLSQVGDSYSGMNIKRMIPAVQGTPGDDDDPMVVVAERYQDRSAENPDGRFSVVIPEIGILHNGENPYEDGIPIVAYHWGPVTTTIWTRDYVSPLIPLQLAYSRALSDLREYGNAFVKTEKLLGGNLDIDDLGETDTPRVVKGGIGPMGEKLIQFAEPPQIPSWFMNHIQEIKRAFDELAGGADLFRETSFPGQVRGTFGFPMLQEILDTEWGPFMVHLGTRMARVKQMRVNRAKQFYSGMRIMNYVSNDMRNEVLMFKSSDILQAGTEFNITVEPSSLVPELRAMREQRIVNRIQNFPQLYMDDRTGMLDKGKLARDLQIGDTARVSKEAAARKLANEIIAIIKQGKQPPPVLPWYDFVSMLDEFEDALNTMENLQSSPQVIQQLAGYWQDLSNALSEQVQASAEAEQQENIQGIVNQAAQQAALQGATQAAEMAVEMQLEGLRQFAAQGGDINAALLATGGQQPPQEQ